MRSRELSANGALFRSFIEQLPKAFTQQGYFATFSLYMQLSQNLMLLPKH